MTRAAPSGEVRTLMLARSELLPCAAANALHLILLPTEACNFRCSYCYEDFALGRMSPELVRGVERFIARRAPILDRLDLSWFGGEPLLALDIVERVLRHARRLQRRHPRLVVASDMTTNAYSLGVGVFRRLFDLGLTRYTISLDGPRELHDLARLRRNGGPTFDRIWSHLVALRDEPGSFRVTLRLHVSATNLEAMPSFLRELQATFGDDPRFVLLFKALSRWGGTCDETLAVLDPESWERAHAELRAEAERLGLRLQDPLGEDGVCYAAKLNSFLVRSDGRLGKCTLALQHPANNVGRLRPDGRIELDPDAWLAWGRGLFSGDAGELACPMRGHADRLSERPSVRWVA
jgi:uncharacterized protein